MHAVLKQNCAIIIKLKQDEIYMHIVDFNHLLHNLFAKAK